MAALLEYKILCPMRSVAKFVPVVPISSPREEISLVLLRLELSCIESKPHNTVLNCLDDIVTRSFTIFTANHPENNMVLLLYPFFLSYDEGRTAWQSIQLAIIHQMPTERPDTFFLLYITEYHMCRSQV